ncbi:unnamed protein product [Caretta caretta]
MNSIPKEERVDQIWGEDFASPLSCPFLPPAETSTPRSPTTCCLSMLTRKMECGTGIEDSGAGGWQSRYFVLDFETGILQYFVNEQSKNQKPRGALSLAGAIISLSDEVPHMLVVYFANGETYKLRAADAKEKQYWVTQLRTCAKYHTEGNSKNTPSSRNRSLSLLPSGMSNSASPSSQKHQGQSGPTVVTVTHHKSPAAARRAKSQYTGQLHEVKEIMSQVEGQQKNLVQAIESLPGSGPLSALDQDLLLLKATSAATLSCLGECLNLLQHSMHQAGQHNNRTLPSAVQAIYYQCLKWLTLRIVKEFGKDVLHVDEGKLFCTICSQVLDRVKKDHILNHIKGPCHIAAMEKRKQRLESSNETAAKQQRTITGVLAQQNENQKYREKIVQDWVEACCNANITLEKTDKM